MKEPGLGSAFHNHSCEYFLQSMDVNLDLNQWTKFLKEKSDRIYERHEHSEWVAGNQRL